MAAIFAIGSGSPTPRLSEDFSQQAQHFVSTCMTRYVKWLVKLTDWLTHSLLTHWWLTDWLAGWLDGWMAGWMADWLADWITDWLTDWLTNGLAGWMDGWQTDRRLCCSDNDTPGVRCSSLLTFVCMCSTGIQRWGLQHISFNGTSSLQGSNVFSTEYMVSLLPSPADMCRGYFKCHQSNPIIVKIRLDQWESRNLQPRLVPRLSLTE